MYGFVSSPIVSASTFRGSVVVSRCSVSAAKWTMEQSESVPFMPKPQALTGKEPAYAGFDPLGLSSTLNVKWLQEAEIKHGRICMLAFLGAVIQELYTFPFYKNTPQLFVEGHDYGAHNGSLLQVLIFTSFFEAITLPAIIQMVKGTSDREPGNFSLDFFGLMEKDPSMKKKEIKNGRLAMLAISGVLTQEVLYNQKILEQLASGNVIPKF